MTATAKTPPTTLPTMIGTLLSMASELAPDIWVEVPFCPLCLEPPLLVSWYLYDSEWLGRQVTSEATYIELSVDAEESALDMEEDALRIGV